MTETTIYVLQETEDQKCYQCKLTVNYFDSCGVADNLLDIIEVPSDSDTVMMLRDRGFSSFPVVVPDQNWDRAWCGLKRDSIKEHAKELIQQKQLVA